MLCIQGEFRGRKRGLLWPERRGGGEREGGQGGKFCLPSVLKGKL